MRNIIGKIIFVLGLCFTTASAFASPSVSGCTGSADDGVSDSVDIRAVLWNINDDWSDFEDVVESLSGYNLRNAIENDFADGNVECDYGDDFFSYCNLTDAPAVSMPLGKSIVCESFIDGIDNEAQKDRRACYAGLLTEYFELANLRTSRAAETIGRAAFEYWKDRFSSSIDYDECGIE